MLTAESLLTRGYFHDRVIPPMSALSLAAALPHADDVIKDMEADARKAKTPIRSRCSHQSVPKRKHLRRVLAIPNPFHQIKLANCIERNWTRLETFCKQSPIALSTPRVSTERALESTYDINSQSRVRAARSVGCRYLLKADISRFYPSIYTHSIPWALHGKTASRQQPNLYGNQLDKTIRDTQDMQTGGVPIGPDTSYLCAEVIGSAIDQHLDAAVRSLKGTRFVDDYYLYFPTLSGAEAALAALHRAAKQFELEINDAKTEIVPLPEGLEPGWKTELRGIDLGGTGSAQSTQLLGLFNKSYELARQYPDDSVFTYAAKLTLSSLLDPDSLQLAISLLSRAVLFEPTMLVVYLALLKKYEAWGPDLSDVERTVNELCFYHGPLQQGFEVAWALWIAREMDLAINRHVAKTVAKVEDDIVALVSLDLRENGQFPGVDLSLWDSMCREEHLYSEHWLLAYEAKIKGWLPVRRKTDYVAHDPFFTLLRDAGVQFYEQPGVLTIDSYYGMSTELVQVDADQETAEVSDGN